jgi:hypothetical protein
LTRRRKIEEINRLASLLWMCLSSVHVDRFDIIRLVMDKWISVMLNVSDIIPSDGNFGGK